MLSLGFEVTDGAQLQRYHHIDKDDLERQFLLTTAEYFLLLADVRWTYSGNVCLQSCKVRACYVFSLSFMITYVCIYGCLKRFLELC